ncbi:MAG: ribosome biogenesis GTPase YlqF [Bacillota bacterium]|nr:ribosome biogenesis GTPase YlqF [Bacillota bacterium]
MPINWYPGHMKKTSDIIVENLKLVDVVVELRDARIPISSRNPKFDELLQGKSRLIVLNKSDLADEAAMHRFVRQSKDPVFVLNAVSGKGISELTQEIEKGTEALRAKLARQGRKMRPIRAMIVGIPNVGKSTLINRLAGKNVAQTGDRPGVTRGKQWIRLAKNIELFDTPGILWPKIDDDSVGMKLACTGAIKDQVLPLEELALALLSLLQPHWDAIRSVYGIEELMELPEDMTLDTAELRFLYTIGHRRGCLMKGGVVDLERAAKFLIDDYRAGKLGRFTLDEV